ncbi:hypothetical protein [Frigoriglobus tundricola]|uniref:Zinc finger/thioredoxin putative domain-containing protein n=1 Tax=Frigoriglobus tundricola TaxID=2774151 RepID=A0A6M5YXN4_9BACT|nr:hypothetical protein [Frigoriglobus tundricola]QJW98745.1 hypothetical protein FTUN_6340 [Frigoriglobus tundricola]
MAIEFDCPHCQQHYRLKDELAGKAATCKGCRQKIVIPKPVTIPNDRLSPELLAAREAEALAALADDAAKAETKQRVIDVECGYCGNKWTEPLTRAGKNTLCPNPECRQRIKIPEAKAEETLDWRQTRTKGPSLAKDNQLQKLEGVQDAAEVVNVSHTALKEADATGIELEPRPLKQKVMFALIALGLVGGLVLGVLQLTRSRTEKVEDRLMQEAVAEFAKEADALPKDEKPLLTAVMHAAAGEHALRHNTKEKFKEAMDQYAKAREALRVGTSPARNAACAELALAFLALGGTEQEARDQVRIRWMPEANLKTRPNERVFTIFEELQKTLDLVAGADPEFRTHLARRLARELTARGQPVVAVELIPVALFSPAEQPEVKAVVALEIYRADKGSGLPRKVADELKSRTADLSRSPSAQTLFHVLGIEKQFLAPPGQGTVVDSTRMAYTGKYLLEGKTDEALELARRPGLAAGQVRAFLLCADWSSDPTSALNEADAVLSAAAGKKDGSVSPYNVLRLTQIAAAAGKPELVKKFTALLADEALKAWATGDAVRLRLAAAPREKGDDAWAEVPDDARKIRAGQVWARFWLARQNARISGSRADSVRAVSGWPTPIVPFGKAGVALGIQDGAK